MEYKKKWNYQNDTTYQPSKFRTRNWIEINDKSRGTYNANSNITSKVSTIKSKLCDYSDAYIHVKSTITLSNAAAKMDL